MVRYLLALLVVVAACEKTAPTSQQGQAPKGIPPLAPGQAGSDVDNDDAVDPPANPHMGMETGAGAPVGDLANPHAGAPMANPHGGNVPGGPVAVANPNMVIEGTISAGKELADQIKTGDRIFLTVRSVGDDGEVVRFPIAADRLDVVKLPMSFRLDSDNLMKSAAFAGKVEVLARVDRDGETRTRQPGDLEGKVVVTIPDKNAKLVLDTAVE